MSVAIDEALFPSGKWTSKLDGGGGGGGDEWPFNYTFFPAGDKASGRGRAGRVGVAWRPPLPPTPLLRSVIVNLYLCASPLGRLMGLTLTGPFSSRWSGNVLIGRTH